MARDTTYALYKTGRVDPTYQNVWGFATESQRNNWLLSKQPFVLTAQKYWRICSDIKVNIRYENSFDYDYIVIQNNTSDPDLTRTWYCFITSRAYISNNVTLMQLEVDWMQTFYFSTLADGGKVPFYDISGFITKTTLSINPPRGTGVDFPVPESSCQTLRYANFGYALVLYSTIDPNTLSDTVVQYQSAIIDGQYTACPPYIMLLNIDNISNIINKFNTLGYTDAISGLYLVPLDYVNVTAVSTTPQLATNSNIYLTPTINVPRETMCDGYTPKNSVLLGYDYSYFTINNGQGEVITYHYEDFNGTPSFTARMSLASGSPTLILYPTNYKDKDTNNYRQRAIKITNAPFCTYLNDNYKIWLAQTQNSRAAAINGAQLAIDQATYAREHSSAVGLANQYNQVSDAVVPTITRGIAQYYATTDSVSSAVDTVGSALTTTASKMGKGIVNSIYAVKLAKSLAGYPSTSTTSSFGGGTSDGNGAGRSFGESLWDKAADRVNLVDQIIRKQLGIEDVYQYDFAVQNAQQGLNQLLASYADKSRLPATAVGSNAYGNMCVLQQYGFMIATFTPTAQYAQLIDNMLTASGHTCNTYAQFEKEHTVFDYIQMQSPELASAIGDRPEFVRKMMVSLFQQGFYIWYYNNGDISNRIGTPYGLNNPEVS